MFNRFLYITILLAGVAAMALPARGQVLQELPEVAKGISVEQKLGADLPLHLEFDDDQNNHIRLGEIFQKGRPVVLSFNYSDCPQLCVVQLNNLAAALHPINLVPGKDFEIVSVSLDPTEQSKKLRETKLKYVTAYGNMDSADGWHFLRSSKKNVSDLADACGFKYKYVPEQRLYSHPSAFIFCTPDGRIARYLNGLDGKLEESLKPALMEASRGEIGNLVDKFMYFAGCYYFDPSTGKYSFAAISVMRLAAGLTVLALVFGLAPYWFRRSTRQANRNKTDNAGSIKPVEPSTH